MQSSKWTITTNWRVALGGMGVAVCCLGLAGGIALMEGLPAPSWQRTVGSVMGVLIVVIGGFMALIGVCGTDWN